MKKWLLAVALGLSAFAVLGGGGCGGSGGGGGQQGRDLSGSDMASYLTGDRYRALVNEYVAAAQNSAAAKAAIEKVKFFREAYEGESGAVPDEELAADLTNGKVMALVYPDEQMINDFLDALGVDEDYARP